MSFFALHFGLFKRLTLIISFLFGPDQSQTTRSIRPFGQGPLIDHQINSGQSIIKGPKL